MVFRKILPGFGLRYVRRRAGRWIINDLPKTYNDVVYPQLPFKITEKPYRVKNPNANNSGDQLRNLTFTLTDLFRDERIVLNINKAYVLRTHAERLIVEAMRNGDCHRPTMELANFWLREKNLIHKLFKVIVPRYSDYSSAFTALHMLGRDYKKSAIPLKDVLDGKGWRWHGRGEAILELRGNELPPIIRPKLDRSGLLTNVLIDGARESSRRQVVAEAAAHRVAAKFAEANAQQTPIVTNVNANT